MLRRRNIRTPKLREQRRNSILNFVAVFLALLGAVVLLLSQLSMLPAISVQTIAVEGDDVLTKTDIVSFAQEEMRGYYLNLFSKRNIFLYPKGDIESEIIRAYPRVKTVDVSFNTFSKIVIAIEERQTYALYCVTSEMRSCYLVDDEGVIFAEAPLFSSHSYFIYNTPVADRRTVRSRVLGRDAFDQFETFRDVLSQVVSISPERLRVEDPNRFELYMENSARIIFDPSDGYEQILQDLHAIVQSEEFQAEAGENLEHLLYIDLRFGNKVFYKLDNE